MIVFGETSKSNVLKMKHNFKPDNKTNFPVQTEHSEYSSGVAELVNDIMNTDSNRISAPHRYNFKYEAGLPSAKTI